MANQIAESYRTHRQELLLEIVENTMNALEERRAVQQEKVKAAQDEVVRLRAELMIDDPEPMGTKYTPTLSADVLRQLQSQSILLKSMEVKEDTQLKRLRELNRKELRDSIHSALTQPDTALATLINELDVLEMRQMDSQFLAQKPWQRDLGYTNVDDAIH